MTKKILSAALLLSWWGEPLCAATYKIDPTHSAVTFEISHLTISKVHGRFDRFAGSIDYEPGKPNLWKAQAAIDVASINTNVEARDKHLRSADFFNVEKFPSMIFKSTGVSKVRGMKGRLQGELTLLGVTKPVVLEVEGSGPVKDPWGDERLGAVARTKINRKDFGMVWNKTLDNGGLMIGEEVEIVLELECVKEKGSPERK